MTATTTPRRATERGFTLIELLVVIVIIGILLAIAVPSYLRFQERADDSAAKANVRSVLPAVEAYHSDKGSYAGITPEKLKASYDAGLKTAGLNVSSTSPTTYCVSASVNGNTWTKAGPDAEISAGGACPSDAYSAKVLATPGLVSYWRLGESSGTSAADAKGGNSGTYTGGVTLGVPGALPNSDDKAASFDGVNDHVTVPDAPELRLTGDMTLEFWAKKSGDPGDWARIVGKGSPGPRNYGLWEWPGASGRLYYQEYGGGNHLEANAQIATGTWYHVVVTVNGGATSLYVNGARDPVTSVRAGPPATSDDPFTIAFAGFHTYFQGAVDEVAIYNTALTQTQIQEHYNAR